MSEKVINGYRLLTPLSSNKSGFGKWGFAEKDGIEVFIKEFLFPVYPMDETLFSPEQLTQNRDICRDFIKKKYRFYQELKKCNSGNIVVVLDFFRYKTKFYAVTDKVTNKAISPDIVFQMDMKQKILLLKVICFNIEELHRHKIVHADIKPENILFKQTSSGVYIPKIIDFDSSFFSEEILDPETEFQGDLVYLAPESMRFMSGENVTLTTKIDVFALGVLLYQYFIGELPNFYGGDYQYSFEAVLDDCQLVFPNDPGDDIVKLLKSMLQKEPEDRPPLSLVTKTLEHIGKRTTRKGFFRKMGNDNSLLL